MSPLTKEQILSAVDIKTAEISVPEWGGNIRVQGFTAAMRDQLMQRLQKIKSETGVEPSYTQMKLALLGFAIIDDSGNRLFTDEEISILEKKSAAVIDRVYAEAEKLNAVDVKTSDAIEKN